jgi:ribonuclease HI
MRSCDHVCNLYEGKSVTDGIDKHNRDHRQKALDEFDNIVRLIPNKSLQIFTDGSQIDKAVGSGFVIYRHKEKIIESKTTLSNCTNNVGELYAIFDALKWVNLNRHQLVSTKELHIFSDSRYSIDALCMHSRLNSHHNLVNRIHDSVALSSFEVIFHWIPSHIEINTHACVKRKIIGNCIADRLASEAAKNRTSSALNYKEDFINNPTRITRETAYLTHKIDLELKNALGSHDPKHAGPSSDDFSSTDAKQVSLGRSVTS